MQVWQEAMHGESIVTQIYGRHLTATEGRETSRGVQPAGGCGQGRCGSRCDEAKYCGIQLYEIT